MTLLNLPRMQLQALCCLGVVSPQNKQAKWDERNGLSFKMATLDLHDTPLFPVLV